MAGNNRLTGAVDIGGTKIAVGLVDDSGRVVVQRSFPTAYVNGWQSGVDAIGVALADCEEQAGQAVTLLGVGCTGPVEPGSGVVGNVGLLPGWQGCPLADALGAECGVEVLVENDADAAALAEYRWGAGRGASRFLYVTVSTGIGTGFVLQGSLYRGANGCHPEMGHHIIDPAGVACYCGSNGCWESLASGTAIARTFHHSRQALGFKEAEHDARIVFQLAELGDATAAGIIEKWLAHLSVGLANVTNILAPGVIALGGGVMQSASIHLEDLQTRVSQRCGEVATANTRLTAAELRGDVGLAGAAAVALHGRIDDVHTFER